ncbi:NAD-dependent epimerase/dehydratase family protein [Haliangium ochraceum]|uniref:NAD-dependent epimerase/dehydratase n=1 Tax=Haliangium ochraceum (strain DSM 14365 / JCM 11303 / SMP-2) TaxID=502025 RepID=D0LTQ7_HALO1|nr:NAD-dependent epimerase/dehydratase family protein [Haliangium ochraceum]ACY15751.1 NAD-dependent epimerase/dehydratase [Haliangium ochraceum DSM 14365]
MRVLVTGGTGFLGEHLVQQLMGAEHQVVALARSRSPVLDALADEHGDERLRFVRGDVLSGDSLDEALSGCEAVFHLAGMVSREPGDARAMMRLHIDGTRRVLERMHAAGVGRMILASTSGTVAVSKDEEILDEDAGYATEVVAGWPYYASKIYQETLALSRGPELGIEVVAINPSLLLGPGDRRMSSTTDVVRFLRGQVRVIPEGGVNFVDVRDAAQAMVAALSAGRAGERYLLGGPNLTVAEFFGRLSRAAKLPPPRIHLPEAIGKVARFGASLIEHAYRSRGYGEPPVDRISLEMAQHYWWLDASKAQRELGFAVREPSLTLVETVRYLRQDLGVAA